MRSIVASLLLVFALPGLLLPAGVVWHFCRCVARVAAPAPACCQHETAQTSESEPTCCHGRAQAGTPTPNDGTPHAKAHACGCVWLALPELQQQPTPPDVATPAPLLPPAAIEIVAWIAPREAAPQHAWCTADVYHPPPGTHRNLPLRL